MKDSEGLWEAVWKTAVVILLTGILTMQATTIFRPRKLEVTLRSDEKAPITVILGGGLQNIHREWNGGRP